MAFNQEQRELVEKIIRERDSFQGREDLLESFCAEVYKKSYLLLDSVSNIENLKNYLQKVADTSIANVLNEIKGQKSSAVKSIEAGPVQHKFGGERPPVSEFTLGERKLPNAPLRGHEITSIKSGTKEVQSIKSPMDVFSDIKDPAELVKQELLSKNTAQKMVNIIWEIHQKIPAKYYYQIFYLRHIRLKKQAEIANHLGITQGELSKRYWELVKLVRDNF